MNEIGRELSAAELKPKTVVVLGRVDRPAHAVTVWVDDIGPDWVAFYSGVIKGTFIAHLREDGTLGDDTGLQVRVWEYLGAI